MSTVLMEVREEAFREENEETLNSMDLIGLKRELRGKYKEAEALSRQTLALYEIVLGREHLSTLVSMYCLAHLFASQHCYKESIPLYQKAYTAFHTILGTDHPYTRACRQHYIQAQVQASIEQSPSHLSAQHPDRSSSIRTGKVPRVARG
jgi:hypothetical protein